MQRILYFLGEDDGLLPGLVFCSTFFLWYKYVVIFMNVWYVKFIKIYIKDIFLWLSLDCLDSMIYVLSLKIITADTHAGFLGKPKVLLLRNFIKCFFFKKN